MSPAIPTTYADAKIQTQRLGELHQCLMAHEFALVWNEPGRYWAIRDERSQEESLENSDHG